MRKGKNPAKLEENKKVNTEGFHQIIVPVYLPNLKGYYKDGLKIFKLCLESIYLTVHDKTFISIVNNGSCQEVRDYLNFCLKDGKIHEIIHTASIGKINAIAKGLAGHNFDLVTITDADVLFINGWQEAIYKIFEAFPKAGMVGTTPNSKLYKYCNKIFILDTLFSKKTKFVDVIDPKSMEMFILSLGYKEFKPNILKEKILAIQKNNTMAYAGCGHFCFTAKGLALNELKKIYSNELLSPIYDKLYVDNLLSKHGNWRLTTNKNYTFHLGNVYEKWMKIEFKKINKETGNLPRIKLKYKTINPYFVKIINALISKILNINYFAKKYKIFKGLSAQEADNYKF